MESAGRKQLLEKIKEIRKSDFRGMLRLHFPDADFAVSIFAEEITISRFLYLLERVLNQMEGALNGKEWDLLPNSFNFKPIDNSVDFSVFQRFNEMLEQFDEKHWAGCLIRLRWLIQYQKTNDIWSDFADQQSRNTDAQIEEKLSEVSNIESRLNTLWKQFESEKASVIQIKKTVGEFYANKQKELKTITNSVDTVNRQVETINQLATTAAEHHGKLKARSEEGATLITILHEKEAEEETKFKAFRSEIEQLIRDSEAKHQKADEKLKSAEVLQAEIEGKRDEISKLLGLAADGALGQWFDKRHESVSRSLRFWRWAVPITTVLSLAWAICVFLWIGASTGDAYLNLAINVIKTLPAWVLLAFSLRQYGRERFVEEEYAFRAAISKTIKTYTDMLEKSDTEDNKSRNEMLREVLKQIYAMPRLQPEYKPGIMRVRSQDLPAVLKEFNRAVGKGEAEDK